ncbi:MAG: hypothetical protein HAW67_02535 [Endozoicomonadaceae bacterium]|nr:hypothetical protein [Endozoicomonadaceae bacterium]
MSKFSVDKTKGEDEEEQALDQEIKNQSKKLSEAFAVKLKDELFVPIDFYREMSLATELANVSWGGRRISRLLSFSFNIVDNEVLEKRIEPCDRKLIESLLVHICFLHIITVKEVLKSAKYRDKCKGLFMDILQKSYVDVEKPLSKELMEFIIDTSVNHREMLAGENKVVDVFNDACMLDECLYTQMKQSPKCNTVLGNNQVYQSFTARASRENIGYDFLLFLQNLIGKNDVVLIDNKIYESQNG